MSNLRDRFREDIASARRRDPALTSTWDAAINAPGLHALWAYRLAHQLWLRGGISRFMGRLVSTVARAVTGVEIHPAARIGRRCYIDHGMGVVIGATAVIGDDALLYHGATLGAVSPVPGRRHPTLGDGVMVGAGAKLLGAIHVGDGAKIGANAVVVHDVPTGATVVGFPQHSRDHPASLRT